MEKNETAITELSKLRATLQADKKESCYVIVVDLALKELRASPEGGVRMLSELKRLFDAQAEDSRGKLRLFKAAKFDRHSRAVEKIQALVKENTP